MRIHLSLLSLLIAVPATFAEEFILLWIPPLDTAIVSLDDAADPGAALHQGTTRRGAPSAALLIAREFYPRFGAAVRLATREAEAVDSSAASPETLFGARLLRLAAPDGDGDSLSFRLPPPDADSSRYVLLTGHLGFSLESRNMPRRFVPPSPPAFDPATGRIEPGVRKGYTEGAGIMNTLTAAAAWLIWDREQDAILAYGTASGSASFRRDARRDNWNEAARELAKDVLRQTPFSPFR